jgi:CTP synthase (UTP-ammonia lyase)
MSIALIGDFNEEVPAHKAIPLAISAAAPALDYQWIHSDDIDVNKLEQFSGFWCVPASPYSNMENVLTVIQYARTKNIPFLGTCGGYQHAALEYARNALGYAEANNAEVTPDTTMPLISALSCKLYDVKNSVNLVEGSFLKKIYASDHIDEEYYCGYGINPRYHRIFEGSDLSFSAHDEDGDPKALEITKNNFFIGTAFQPERSIFSGTIHPLIRTFLASASFT